MPNPIAILLLAACFLPGLSLRSSTTPAVAASDRFPSIQATDLDHAQLNLPRQFAGELNLVILSFEREQQPVVDTWVPEARQIESSHGKFRFYELLAMTRQNMLYRWWFNAALRSNTTDTDLRSRILTAYVNTHAFRKPLRIANEKHVVAVLVDQTGKVYWRTDGACTPEKAAALQAALASNGTARAER